MRKPSEKCKRITLFNFRFTQNKHWVWVLFICLIPPICLLIAPLLQLVDSSIHKIITCYLDFVNSIKKTPLSISAEKFSFPSLALTIMFGYNIVYTASMAVAPFSNDAVPIQDYFPSEGRLLVQQVCICLAFVCELFSFRALGFVIVVVFLCWSICSVLLFICSNTGRDHASMQGKLDKLAAELAAERKRKRIDA